MANSINLKIKVDDDGTIDIVAKEARKAKKATDDLADSTDNVNTKKNRYNRLEKGAAQLTANSTKAFAKQTQVVGGGLVPAYAVLASNVFALSAAFNFFKRAADVKILEQSQVSFAENTGQALGVVTNRLREASGGMLGFQEAAQASAIGLAKGFSPKQMEELAEGARKASTALGRDFQDSFDRLVRGASKAEPELLDELGITLRLEEATQRYADAIGRNRDELTAAQRSQAVLIETQRQLNDLFGDVDAAVNPFVALSKTFEDIVKAGTQFILPLFEGIASILNRSGEAAVAVFGLIGLSIAKMALPIDQIGEAFAEMGSNAAARMDQATEAVERLKNEAKEAKQVLKDQQMPATKTAARGIMKQGKNAGQSKILQKVAKGQELSPQERGRLKKMLKDAEAQYRRHGKIIRNTFQGVNIDMVRQLDASLKKMDRANAGFFTRIGTRFKMMKLRGGQAFAFLRKAGVGTFQFLGRQAARMGKALDKAMRFAGVIGILIMLKEMVMAVVESPFSILKAVASGIDKTLGFVITGVNFIMPSILSVADAAKNAFSKAVQGIKRFFSDMISALFSGIDGFINGIVDKINGFISTLNNFTGKDFPLIEFASDLAGSFGGFGQGEAAISNMAGEFVPFNTEVGIAAAALERLDAVVGLSNWENDMQGAKRSKEALDSYKQSLDEVKKSIDGVTNGMEKETDEAKKGQKVAAAIQSLQLSAAVDRLRASRNIILANGEESKEAVFRAEEQEKAIEALRQSMAGLGGVHAEYARVVLEAAEGSEEARQRMLELETASNQAVAGQAALKDGIGQIGQQMRESLSGGDIFSALDNLESLRRTAEDTSNSFYTLGENDAAAQAMNDYNQSLKETGKNADEFLITLRELAIGFEMVAAAQLTAGFTSGATNARLTIQNEISKKKLELTAKQTALDAAKGTQDEDKLRREEKLLALELKLLEARRGSQSLQRMADITGSASTANAAEGDVTRAALEANVQFAQNKLEEIRASGKATQDEINAAIEAVNAAQVAQILGGVQNMSNAFSALAEDFKKLGPEGEAMAAMSQGIANISALGVEAFQTFATEGTTASQKVMAAMNLVGGTIQAIGAMQKAAAEQKVRAIDQEINAEKKRDGKSKESLAKIAALEKKKDAQKRKAFEADKKMKIAQTVMATATGAIEAYKSLAGIPYVGPFLGAAAAAAVIAMGAKQLSTIQSMTYNGGGSAPSASQPSSISMGDRRNSVDLASSRSARGELAYFRGASGQGGPEAFTPAFSGYKNRAEGGNTAFMVGEQGPELFVPETPGTIVPNDDIVGGGSTNVTFNISTVDATGVEDLLMRQQGNIIGMIRGAANSYGQDFIEEVDTSVFGETTGGALKY